MSSGKIWFDKELIENVTASHIYQKRNRKKHETPLPKPVELIFTVH